MSGGRVELALDLHHRASTASALRALIAVQRRALELGETIDRDLRQVGWDAIEAGLDVLIEQLPPDPVWRLRR